MVKAEYRGNCALKNQKGPQNKDIIKGATVVPAAYEDSKIKPDKAARTPIMPVIYLSAI